MNETLTFKEIFTYSIVIIGVLTSIFTVLLLYVKRASERTAQQRYDSERHIIELEYMRKNLELNLFEISKRLEETDSRWKDINHLVIASQDKLESNKYVKSNISPNDFLKNFGITDAKEYEVDKRLVFVLTPFSEVYFKSFEAIKEACQSLQLKCIRGDEEFHTSEIFTNILKQIIRSRFVIANITGRNPNVMYELGIAHAIGKPAIIVSENFTDIPFDLNNKRIIIYENHRDLRNKLENTIKDLFINSIV